MCQPTSEEIKQHLKEGILFQELCESPGDRPGLSALTSLTVYVDVHTYMLRHWSQFVPDISTDIRGHQALHHHQNHIRQERSVLESGEERHVKAILILKVR